MSNECKYTISEIDDMRIWVSRLILEKESGQSYRQGERDAQVELQLRTYLDRGFKPIDVKEAVIAFHKRNSLRTGLITGSIFYSNGERLDMPEFTDSEIAQMKDTYKRNQDIERRIQNVHSQL